MLTLTAQCTWTLRIGDREINLQQLQSQLQPLGSLLSCVESTRWCSYYQLCMGTSKFCASNADAKFEVISRRHHGDFRDQSGKSRVYSFVRRHFHILHYSCIQVQTCLLTRTIELFHVRQFATASMLRSIRCQKCSEYRSTLYGIGSRERRHSSTSRSDALAM